MKPSILSIASVLLAVAALGLPLAGCGGGGESTGGARSITADVPQAPAVPPAPDTPQPGPAPQPGDDPAEDPADPGDVQDDPALPPDGSDVTPLDAPAELLRWSGLEDVRALALDAEERLLYAASSESGQLWRIAIDQVDVEQGGLLAVEGSVRALAFDPGRKLVFAVLDPAPGQIDRLLRIQPAAFVAGAGAPEADDLGPIGDYASIEALAFDAEQEVLYAVDGDTDALISIHPESAATQLVAKLEGLGEVVGLAPDRDARNLLATDGEDNVLATIDVSSGAVTVLAALDEERVEGLAADPESDVLYGATVSPADVFAFDPVGRRWAFAEIRGMAFDPADQRYFGVHTASGVILKIDADTKQREMIGFVPVPGLEGLAYDEGQRLLYAVSRATQHLYTLPVDGLTIQADQLLHGAAAPYLGLAALTFHRGALYAADVDAGNLLRIEPDTGNAVVVAPTVGFPQIEGLASDSVANVLHAFDNAQRAYLLLDLRAPNAPVIIHRDQIGAVGGLAWNAQARELVGTDTIENDLVLVRAAPEPSPVGYQSLSALGYRTDTQQMLAFDRDTRTLLEIDPGLKIGIPVATLDDVAVEGMTFLPDKGRLIAVDADAGSLYLVDAEGSLLPIGPAGFLAPRRVKALAHDGERGVLFGVDVDANVLLAIDPDPGNVDVIDPSDVGLGYATVEALAFDAQTGTLLGLDRATRTLLRIDRDIGTAEPLGLVDAIDVAGMENLPGSAILWLASGGDLVSVDKHSGDPLEPGPTLALEDTAGDGLGDVKLFWPQGDVRRDALATCAVEVGASYEGALDLELRCGDRVLHRSQLTPEGALARFQIPEGVRAALESGAAITWRVGNVSAAFRVVDETSGRADIQAILAHPTVTSRSDWQRRLVEAYALDRAGLHSEALVVGIGTYETYPDHPTSARALLKTLEHLGLVQTRLGREIFLKALRP